MNSSNSDILRLAPPSVDVDSLPKPLHDGTQALTVDEARETYLRIERASWNSDERTSKHMRHRSELYPRILESDRRFQEQYKGLTTAKLTRGLSPFDESGERLTPWELDAMLNGGTIRRSVREALNYHLSRKRDLEFEWVGVTSVTQTTGAPREYIYLWIEDPGNEVSADWLSPTLDRHLDRCANASEENHAYHESGTAGAITVRHSPPLADHSKDDFWKIQEASEEPSYPNTTGAKFVAGQLVHLPVGDYVNSERDNPSDTLLNGGALGWASPYRWFRASGGVPNIL